MAKTTQGGRIRITRRVKAAGLSLMIGFSHGLSQMGSFGSVGSLAKYPKPNSDSMRGDWQRVGADLQTSFEKVRDREKAKA